jgi:transcriptional regulator with XRE-family HTH domain
MLTPNQCRAGRALLGWSQEELSKRAQIAVATIANFEREATTPIRSNQTAIIRAFDDAGVTFDLAEGQGIGVRMKQ